MGELNYLETRNIERSSYPVTEKYQEDYLYKNIYFSKLLQLLLLLLYLFVCITKAIALHAVF